MKKKPEGSRPEERHKVERRLERNLPPTGTVVRTIGWITFQEIVSDKVLYNVFVCAFLLFGLGYLTSRLTAVQPDRVILDFGMTAVMLSCAIIAIFTGSGLLAKELDRKTIHVALSRPISKAQFMLGKYAGLGAVLTLNWLILGGAYLAILLFSTDKGTEILSGTLFSGLFLILIQSLLIASISILFSTFSTTSLSVMLSVGLCLIGSNISQLRLLASKTKSVVGSTLLNSVAGILPNLEYFNLGTKVTYGVPVTWQFMVTGTLYGFFVITLLLSIAGFLIHVREV